MADDPSFCSKSDVTPEEKTLLDALDKLKDIHIQLRDLRTTLPRMFEPFSDGQHRNPEERFKAFMRNVTEAKTEIDAFYACLTSAQSTHALDMANNSRKLDPRGMKPWRARDDPEWATPRTNTEPVHDSNRVQGRACGS